MTKCTVKSWILLSLLLVFPILSAQAQVALPRIIPGAPRVLNARFPVEAENSFVPTNPAALQWGGPTRFGGGLIDGVSSHAISQMSGTIAGKFSGFRLVGETLAVGGQITDYTLESNYGFPSAKSASTLALSFRLPASFAYGYSVTNSTLEMTDISQTTSTEFSKSLLGFSIKMSENWYIGAAVGNEEETRTLPGPLATLERDVRMSGIGFRSTGSVIWHMEASLVDSGDLVAMDGSKTYGHLLKQGVLEVAFWDLIFGITSYNVAGSGTRNNETISGYTLDYGYAPFSGLTITGRFERSTYDANGYVIAVEEINSLVVALQF